MCDKEVNADVLVCLLVRKGSIPYAAAIIPQYGVDCCQLCYPIFSCSFGMMIVRNTITVTLAPAISDTVSA